VPAASVPFQESSCVPPPSVQVLVPTWQSKSIVMSVKVIDTWALTERRSE